MYIQQKILFYETVSPKNHGQVYLDSLLVSFNANTPDITTASHKGEKYLPRLQSYTRVLIKSQVHPLVLHTGKFEILE